MGWGNGWFLGLVEFGRGLGFEIWLVCSVSNSLSNETLLRFFGHELQLENRFFVPDLCMPHRDSKRRAFRRGTVCQKTRSLRRTIKKLQPIYQPTSNHQKPKSKKLFRQHTYFKIFCRITDPREKSIKYIFSLRNRKYYIFESFSTSSGLGFSIFSEQKRVCHVARAVSIKAKSR